MISQTDNSMSDAVVVITGGSRGLGLSIARLVLARGSKVAVVSRRVSEQLSRLMHDYPGRVRHFCVDLSDYDDYAKLTGEFERFGPVEGLVLNAAVGTSSLFALQSPREIESLIALNFTSSTLLTKAVIKPMIRRKQGSVVFISSTAARRAYPGLVMYGAIKAALERVSAGLALELGRYNIRVNCVSPGFLRTDMTATISEQQASSIERRTALGQLPAVESVANVVSSLLFNDLRDIAGAVIPIDSGSEL